MPQVTPHEIQAIQELSQRQKDSLDIFRPLPHQEPYFLSGGSETLVRGGNRSTVEGTILWQVNGRHMGRPADYSIVRVEQLSVGDKVAAYRNSGKRADIVEAEVNSIDIYPESTYRLTTKRGYVVEGTHDHPVWACPPSPARYHNSVDPDFKKGQWVLLRDVPEGWYVRMAFGSYVDWVGEQDDEAYFHGLMDGDGSVESKRSTAMSFAAHREETLIDWVADYVLDNHESINTYRRYSSENGVQLEWCSREMKDRYISWEMPGTPEAMSSYIRGLFDADGCVTKDGKIVFVQKDEDRVKLVQNMLLLFGVRCSLRLQPVDLKSKRINPIWRLQISGFSVKRYAKSIGFAEAGKAEKLEQIAKGRRKPLEGKMWWDRVSLCGPTGEQKKIYAIATSEETYISNGVISHNSGKSTCCAVRFASIARDKPITFADGRKLHMRRKYQRDRELRMWVIAYDAKYIGQTIYRLLFEPGLFKIVRDPDTNQWVTFQPRNPRHQEVEDQVQESPPLIPSSWIVPGSWNFDNAGNKEFTRVKIANPKTGKVLAEVFGYSSKADPKAGDPVDHIWIDEKIRYPKHYGEWQARILDRKGRIDWSSWPATSNTALRDLTKRARKSEEAGDGRVKEVVLRTDDNTSFSEEQFKQWAAGFTEEEYIARVSGEYQTDSLKMYPLFNKELHSALISDDREDDISRELKRNNLEPPKEWTRELILDPGTSHPAVLFCAVPPPYYGNYFVVYDEIYIPRLDARQLAKQIKRRMTGVLFERFIIDPRAARQTPMGFSLTIQQNYANEFEAHGIMSRQTGPNFSYGSDNVGGRIQVLQQWMHIQAKTGLPKLRIVTQRCPNLVEQLESYEKKLVSNIAEDFVPAKGQQIDCAVTLEYWASRNPRYILPEQVAEGEQDAQAVWAQFKKLFLKGKKKESDNTVIMGPPS